jgi:putative salt-induced outer membrane protein
MKKIILSTLVASTLVMAADEAQIKQEIAEVQTSIKNLNNSLKKLQAQLPKESLDRHLFVTHTELGYLETSGNTETKTFNLDTNIKKQWDLHSLELSLLMQYGIEEVENKNKLLLELDYDYRLSEKLFFNYLVGYKDDKFSGYDYQFYTGPGFKYKAINTDAHNLSLNGNLLFSIDSIDDTYQLSGVTVSYPYPAGSINQNDGYTTNYLSYRAKAVYTWQMLQNLKFSQKLSYRAELADFDNYFAYSKTAFTSRLSEMFSGGVSLQHDYANEPADGKANTDRTLTFNLIVDY